MFANVVLEGPHSVAQGMFIGDNLGGGARARFPLKRAFFAAEKGRERGRRIGPL